MLILMLIYVSELYPCAVREIILTGNSKKLFTGKQFVYLGTVKIAILSSERHIGNILQKYITSNVLYIDT